MIDLWLTYKGKGEFICRTQFDHDRAFDKLKQGDWCRAKLTQPRSIKHNNFFHICIKKVFDNLPDGHRYQDEEHLRAHLLVSIGHCDVLELDTSGVDEKMLAILIDRIIDQFLDLKGRVFFKQVGDKLYLRTPKSTSFVAADQAQFKPIADKALEMAAGMIGVTVDDLKKRPEAA